MRTHSIFPMVVLVVFVVLTFVMQNWFSYTTSVIVGGVIALGALLVTLKLSKKYLVKKEKDNNEPVQRV